MKFRNTYFVLRHGRTNFQVKKPDFIYPPNDGPAVRLIEEGKKQVKKSVQKIKKAGIDEIYSSDFFRTAQTARIAARELGIKKINFDKRLRDYNLGVYHGKTKKEFYRDFPVPKERFFKRPKGGESWNDVKKRMVNAIKGIDKKYAGKNILIVSHGDPLWLLEGAVKGLNNQELLDEIFIKKNYIKTGELRKLYGI